MWVGFKTTTITFKVAPRFAGQSSYSFAKLLKLAVDGAFSFSVIPLRIATIVGSILSLVSFGYLCFEVLFNLLTSNVPPVGWRSMIAATSLLGGFQLIVLGVMGEYIGRIYNEVKRRPLYILEQTVGMNDVRK